ncbi:MAG: hypothetical protein OEZ54_03925 [Gemmatimonadota bacterium]|nr:hypothetical protein [Gemmatimonadota bacterium]
MGHYDIRYSDDPDDEEFWDDPLGEDSLEEEEDLDEEDDLLEPEAGYRSGEHDVNISREVDAQGNEVWYAEDATVPGGSSMGNSIEEAMEGMEDRRKEYREMLKRSRRKNLSDSEESQP